MEFTILMPCLNEALTVQRCIRKATSYLERSGIRGEVLIADNGSTDGSQTLAREAGARVVTIREKGYGAALIGGIEAASGRFVIMADADESYDFDNLDEFVNRLRDGFKLVIGNRFKGGISPGAMPVLNRYFGNPALSLVGRILFSSNIGDFHCGMRGFERQAILDLSLRAPGMEFASEMVVKASLAKISIAEVPTTLSPDGRQRAPHLRPWRDGWRHLRFMLLRNPHWLFLYPGLILTAIGVIGASILVVRPIPIPGLFTLDINALLYFCVAVVMGVQIFLFGLSAVALAQKNKIRIATGYLEKLLKLRSLEGVIFSGACLVLTGIAGATYAIIEWGHASFGSLVPTEMMRITIPSVTILAVGLQIMFGALLLGFIEIE